MRARRILPAIVVAALLLSAEQPANAGAEPAKAASPTTRVYGEWRIRVKPDKGADYDNLIATKGLPLFREAGGRMVGWWKTLVGDLYEHVTIWEYDNMAAFENAVKFLGPNKKFAEFVALRDPLLTGEDSRFLRLVEGAEAPSVPDESNVVIHEIHRVPLGKMAAYRRFVTTEKGLPLLKQHGFHPVGPWTVNVGNWTEVTYLFRFESLAEREQLIARFAAHDDAQAYGAAMNQYVDEIATRVLLPAPFAEPAAQKAEVSEPSSPLLPHLEEVAPKVFAAGFADRYRSANCGWVAMKESTLLIDLPRGLDVGEFLSEVQRISGKPARSLALTNLQPGDEATIKALVDHGVELIASLAIRDALTGVFPAGERRVSARRDPSGIGEAGLEAEYLPLDGVASPSGAAVYLPHQQVLFAGPLVVNGPRSQLAGSDTERWIVTLRQLASLEPAKVVPGFGSWGGPEVVGRECNFLAEVRRQVGYVIARGRPESALATEVLISAEDLVWMPYDNPAMEDLQHVYREMTVPNAPFNGRLPEPADPRPHALVLIGDLPHEPGHIEEGLRPVFEATGVVPHFTVDVRALSAENLSKVQLLVILRDGLQRPTDDSNTHYIWMTPEQQQAVVEYVEGGGAFLNLHNSMGLYPDDGPYLHLVGGRYIGHGPLERFRVEVVDKDHPITKGIHGFSVADEQHTPPYDADKVHLLLQNRSDDGTAVAAAGWVYEPGKGRLCHLANGHTRESLLHPMYQRLLRNAVNWCLRRSEN